MLPSDEPDREDRKTVLAWMRERAHEYQSSPDLAAAAIEEFELYYDKADDGSLAWLWDAAASMVRD